MVLVAQGFKNKEMAERMFISEQTVKNHLHNIFDKLGVSDRLELALYAIHHNLHDHGSTARGVSCGLRYSRGAIPSARIFRYRLLRSRPSNSAARLTFPFASSSFFRIYSRSAASRTSCRLP